MITSTSTSMIIMSMDAYNLYSFAFLSPFFLLVLLRMARSFWLF